MTPGRFRAYHGSYKKRVTPARRSDGGGFVADKVYRYEGEEFLITMSRTGLQASQLMIERICEGLAATVPARDGNQSIYITASFGITLLDPDVRIEQSIDRADKAMYAAKAAGRNRVCVWHPLISG